MPSLHAAHAARAHSGATLIALVCVLFLAVLLVPGRAEACGGDGERACCNGCGEYSNVSTACNSGNIIVGTSTSRNCGVGTVVLGVDACDPFGAQITTKDICVAPKPCGGSGQRACCGLERSPSCNGGLVEGPGCSVGDTNCLCTVGGYASGVCTVPACGSSGQRGCCTGEQSARGSNGPCFSGLLELGSCTGSGCACLQPSGSNSLGICTDPGCGGNGQRGCCVGAERTVKGISGPCTGLNVEHGACTGDCACKSPAGSYSSGHCSTPTACGAEGQRACGDGDNLPACQSGLVETNTSLANLFGFSSQSCSAQLGEDACVTPSGLLSNGVCVRVHCGGDGERGCCIGDERSARGIAGPCIAGYAEDTLDGCSENCACTGFAASGNSLGICHQVTPCGGADQRACCAGTGEFPPNPGIFLSCTNGNIQIAGCTGNCFCGGASTGEKSSGTCRVNTHPTPCGGSGQRACCAGTFEVVLGQACNAGLVEVPGCGGDCKCGGFNPNAVFNASGICVPPTACGGVGQRACCSPLGEGAACHTGLFEVPGCSGDCFCGGTIASGQTSSSSCTSPPSPALATISEPDPGWTAPNAGPVCAMRGYADMHLHMFAGMAHGGGVLAGEAWDPGGINEALKQDYGTNLDLVSKTNIQNNTTTELGTPSCPVWLPNCGSKLFHGDHTIVDDTVGVASGDKTNSNLGVPLFNGWPRWSNVTHQQAYYKWLERAWRGGLRLISMLAVTNEALCLGNKKLRGTACDNSMKPLDEQIQAAKDFQVWLDNQYGGPGQGWFQIAYHPADARRIIGAGKLAVVLGLEVDNLFNCKANGSKAWTWDGSTWVKPDGFVFSTQCDESYVRSEVQRYAAMGVRHVFPIHNFDNAYGDTATWFDSINVGNRVGEGFYYTPEECSNLGYGFKLSQLSASVVAKLGFAGLELPPDYSSFTATCNSKTLTSLGHALIDEMMKQHMLIDVDHMGNKALDETLTQAESYPPPFSGQSCNFFDPCANGVCCSSGAHAGQCAPSSDLCNRSQGYPILASHIIPFDLYQQGARTERMRRDDQFARIKALRGMVAPITEMRDSDQNTLIGTPPAVSVQYGDVANDCRRSSKTFAQVYQKTVDLMGGPVGLGTDFNGTAFHLSPRFGNEGCDGIPADRSVQYRANNRLAYPFTADAFGTLGKQVTGQKTFDYNVDGLAHVGLLPDFIADMKQVGLPDATLEMLWQSAEGFVEVWDRAEGNSSAPQSIADNYSGQCRNLLQAINHQPIEMAVNEQCLITPDMFGQAATGDGRLSTTVSFTTAGALNRAFTCADVTATDACTASGASSSCQGCVLPLDKTPPTLNCPPNVTATKTGPLTFPSIPAVTVADNCTTTFYATNFGPFTSVGYFACNRNPAAGFPLGTTTVTCNAHDESLNSSSCSYTVTITPPPAPTAITVTADSGQSKTYGASDPAALTYHVTGTLAQGDAFTGSLTRAAGENAGSHAITQGTLALAGNYTLTFVGANFVINTKAITVTAAAKSKTYGDSDPPLTFTNGNLAFSDAFTGALTRVAGESIGAYAIQQGTLALSNNYALTFVGANLTIGTRAITVAADAKSKTYGDSDPALTSHVTSGSLAFSDGFTGSLTRAAGESAGPYAITQGTLTLGSNYAITFVGANLTIGAKTITVTAVAKSKTYGDSDPPLTYTNGSLAFSDSFNGALTRVAGENVGTYAIQRGTLALSSNYTLTFVGANLTINARTVAVTADPKSKTYGDSDPPLTYQITSGSLGFTDSFLGNISRDAGENAGTHAITQGTLALGNNYAFSFIGANLTIGARPVTVTADPKSKTYGDSDPPLTYQITAGSLAFTDFFLGSITRDAGEDVGAHAIRQGSLALNSNYALTYLGSNLTIGARPVTITAGAKLKTYGDSDPALTFQITSGSLAFSDAFGGALSRVSGENVGVYAILQGTVALTINYTLTYIGATLAIVARPVTVTADAQSRTYGDSDPAFTYQITAGSLAFGNSFTGLLTRAAGEGVGNYAILQGTLALSTNYTLSYAGADLAIGARPVTVTADPKSKTYGDSDPALTDQITAGSLAFSDSFSGALTRNAGEIVGSYAITKGTLALSTNYTLTYVGANLTIGARPVTVTADPQSRTYDAPDPAVFTYQITSGSLAFSDAFTGALARPPGKLDVGTYAITKGTLALNTNYALTYVGALLTINKEPTTTSYTGATAGEYFGTYTLSALVTETAFGGPAAPGTMVHFALGQPQLQSCDGTVDNLGHVSCSIHVLEAAGVYPFLVTASGDGNFEGSSATTPFAVSADTTSLVYTGPTLIANGLPVTVSASFTDSFSQSAPIAGLPITFTLGSQLCTGNTNSIGLATCTIAPVSQPLGPGSIAVSFAGNGDFLPAAATANVLVYAYSTGGGSFVVGNGAASTGSSVTFWGAQWAKINLPSAPASFKGFADLPALPSCNGGFSTLPGNSSSPPGSVPAYMAVIASTSVAKSGSAITGDSPKVVIVKTAPGYAPNPGHAGTGTVVAVLCGLPGGTLASAH